LRFRSGVYILLFIISTLFIGVSCHAQVVGKKDIGIERKHTQDSIAAVKEEQKRIADSTKQSRLHIADSTKQARQHIADSTKDARQEQMKLTAKKRQHYLDSSSAARQKTMDALRDQRKRTTDSLRNIRKHAIDSVTTIRKYKESRHYRDSVTKAKEAKTKALKATRQAYSDSLRAVRKHITDSAIASRKHLLDSVKAIQKKRTDSLAAIKQYRESKHFRDSVQVFKKARLDSMTRARKHRTESMMAARKHIVDSLKKERKRISDSSIAARKIISDKLKNIKKAKTDSLAKVKQQKIASAKVAAKRKEDLLNQKLELKIKQKQEQWNNELMLKKKWSLKRKIIQNTFTRYNYFFNANRKMDEATANMLRRKENYDSLIGLYPFDPNKDSTLLSADMDSIMHKVSVGIQIHDPRTKWADNLYLLLGEAYYYKGKYEGASTAFRYIISNDEQNKKKKNKTNTQSVTKPGAAKEEPSIVENDKKTIIDFLKHKPVHNDAILWLSRTYTTSKQPEKAEAVLALLESDPKLPENLKGKLALEKGFLQLSEYEYKDAVKSLTIAVKDNNIPDWLRMRSAYLAGQLQQRLGNYDSSITSFKKVFAFNPKIDLDFYTRKNIAYSSMYAGGDQGEAIASLKSVLNDGKYTAYYEQVYFILGRLSANTGNYADAEDYLWKGIHSPKSTKKQKAVTFAALGNAYYSEGNYVAAKHAYDSSAILASAAPNDSLVLLAQNRSKALISIVGPATIIHDEDSLLALSTLSNKEQRSVVKQYLKQLQKARRDSINRAENALLTPTPPTLNAPDDAPDVSSWYFSNAVLVQQGYNDFRRKWGNRALTDNWRRLSGGNNFASGSNNTSNSDNNDSTNVTSDVDENGLPTEENLLSYIPNTPEQQVKANKLIERAYVDLGNTYVRELEDYPNAIRVLDTLDKRYPANDQKAQSIYLRYIIALRKSEFEKAKIYSQLLINDYSTSEYAALVKPSEDNPGVGLVNGISIANYYDETYELLMAHQYTDVIMRVNYAYKNYKDPKYNKRFQIVEAIALAFKGDFIQADTILVNFIRQNPSDSLRPWADAVMNYISKNKQNNAQATQTATNNLTSITKTLNTGGVPATPQPSKDTTTVANVRDSSSNRVVPAKFTYKPNEEHYMVLSLGKVEPRAMGLKAGVGDFDAINYRRPDLDVGMQFIAENNVIITIKSFPNAGDAKKYMSALMATKPLFKEYNSSEYQVFIISAKNYAKIFSDHSVFPYLDFYKKNY